MKTGMRLKGLPTERAPNNADFLSYIPEIPQFVV